MPCVAFAIIYWHSWSQLKRQTGSRRLFDGSYATRMRRSRTWSTHHRGTLNRYIARCASFTSITCLRTRPGDIPVTHAIGVGGCLQTFPAPNRLQIARSYGLGTARRRGVSRRAGGKVIPGSGGVSIGSSSSRESDTRNAGAMLRFSMHAGGQRVRAPTAMSVWRSTAGDDIIMQSINSAATRH
jgi:hypothetical protein